MTSPVLSLLSRRLQEGSEPRMRRRGDRAHVALAVEGGGMRGVVSGGMLVALERLGALRAFDSVWGASAGALNAAYFLSGQSDESASIYWERLASSAFISTRRFLRGGDFMSLNYLFDLLRSEYALDVRRVLDSPVPLHPVSFCVDDYRAVDLGHPETEDELFLRLRASAQVPLFAGKPIEIDGRRYLDAACGEFIPVQSALEGGADYVLALHTRSEGACPNPIGRVEHLLYKRFLRPVNARLVDHFETRQHHYVGQMAAIKRLGEHVFSVHPSPEADLVTATERNADVVFRAFQLGVESMLSVWPEPAPTRPWHERLLDGFRRLKPV